MKQLRFINQQWRGDLRWPCGRTAMFTVMDEDGRTVVAHSIDEEGKPCSSPTFYHPGARGLQQFYPLSARRKR